MGFITGCGDEGDPVTEMVSEDDHDHTEHEHEQPVVEEPVAEPPVVEELKVSFKDDISPILAESCATPNCHVGGHFTNLDLSTYDTFKKGGNRGAAFVADNADDSLVVKYIKGEIQPQMPIGGAPLNGEQIQLFIDWINEGAENN